MSFRKNLALFLVLIAFAQSHVAAQAVLTLPEAVQTAATHYGSIKAKENYAAASQAYVTEARRDYLPDLSLSAQQDYGTVNGQLGPLSGNGLSVASAGPTLDHQSWNAAFGALYLANINWDFFAFGRSKEKIKTAQAAAARDYNDWQQEIFEHKIKVAAAYLNLLAAQQLVSSYRKNLARADTFRQVVIARALHGLIAGVDSSQADAEVSGARIALTNAMDAEKERANQLAQLLGVPSQDFILDTLFVRRIPRVLQDSVPLEKHPLLQWYKSRIQASDELARYYRTFNYPAFSLTGIIQTRGSGIGSNYAQDLTDISHGYWDGISPTRTNYLLGIGVTWNLSQPFRVSQQVRAQQLISKGLQDEYELAGQQLKAQLQLADAKIRDALSNYNEAPIQVSSAADAYLQKSVLYKNGLTNLVDVTQALYALTRAETDRDIAYNNVWQALLLKAAATGDFGLFLNGL